jgi:gamma-glutamyltranspeptidase/glutathione hydrolase
LQAGDRLVQKELARTLKRIARRGPRGFYEGPTAAALLKLMAAGGGLMVREDLLAYRAVERPALTGSYRGWAVTAIAPPSCGGQVLLESLNQLEGYALSAMSDAERLHLMAEALRRAFRDRAKYLGDPEANPDMPLSRLVSKPYADLLRAGIDPHRASVSEPAELAAPEPAHTTHLSVTDRAGNAVALTTTLEDSYGSAILVPGAGFLLNNEMGDFNAGPGFTNAEGDIGTAPNLARSGRRMLSNMCPTILAKGDTVLVLGSPGGRTIPSTVLCVLVGLVDLGRDPQAAVDAPRIHHQWLPDRLHVEPGVPAAALEAMGHRIHPVKRQGIAQVIRLRAGKAEGGADHLRWADSAALTE